jgi:hypothetical protein
MVGWQGYASEAAAHKNGSKNPARNLRQSGNLVDVNKLGAVWEASMKETSQDKSECLKRAAEARRLARKTVDSSEKADLFSVERRWRSLGEPSQEEMGS